MLNFYYSFSLKKYLVEILLFLLSYYTCVFYTSTIIRVDYQIAEYNLNQMKKICWIFDHNSVYQVLISFCSVIKNNPNETFHFYLIIPPNMTLNTENFSFFLNPKSKIEVRHFLWKHMERHPTPDETCYHPPLIIVKVFLFEILHEVDKVLYLDSDMINVRPISQIWETPMENKTIGGTKRIHLTNTWINSGFIFYNLNFLRTRSKDLWRCQYLNSCIADDSWHTRCQKDDWVYFFPYRYNVDFYPMRVNMKRTKDQKNEEKNAVFYHVKDFSHIIYTVKNRSEIPSLYAVRRKKQIQNIFENLFDFMQSVELKIENNKKKKKV